MSLRVGIWAEWVDDQIDLIHQAGQWRRPRTFDAAGPVGSLDGQDGAVVSFASNDYLGLTQHPEVKAAAIDAVRSWGTGSAASRLVVGSRSLHEQLEAELAAWKQAERAVLFPTGYAANLGTLAVLGAPGVRICSDELNHASIIDGCRMAATRGAEVRVFPHRDLDALDDALFGAERAVVVTDTVFSMDGDVADLVATAERCVAHRAVLVCDDAHLVLDTPAAAALPDDVDVLRVGTLSKTLGSLGGFVAGPRPFVELIVNRARPYVFTTAPTPADTAAALAALRVTRSEEGDVLRRRLRDHVEHLAPGHPSPIIPVIVGSEAAAIAASEQLLAQGLLVPAIRPPTVAPGTARLRVAVSAAHDHQQVDRLREALAGLRGVS